MTKPLPHTAAGRRVKQKKGDAKRMRRYRSTLKTKGVPASHVIDRALVEALAFHVSRNKRAAESGGVNIEHVGDVGVIELLGTTIIVLEREGFAPQTAGTAMKARIKRLRARHKDPAHVPSLEPGPIDRIRPPKGPNGWHTPMDVILRHLAGPKRGAVAQPDS